MKNKPSNYTLAHLRKKHKRVTTAMMMDTSGVPREDWGGELIAELPQQMRRHAEKIAEDARREADQEVEEQRKSEWQPILQLTGCDL